MNTFTLKVLLAGCEVGTIQTVGNMSVIPLVAKPEYVDDRFMAPTKLRVSTAGYGTLVFRNDDDRVAIVPSGATYIVEQAAQNHAMCKSGFLYPRTRKAFKNAACVQQTTGGYIREDVHPLKFLPVPIRQAAWPVRNNVGNHSYGKLWDSIKKWNRLNDVYSLSGHLEFYFERFDEQIAHFSSEFELVSNQVGAIVIVNDEVVGIEKAPNYEYWQAIWTPLVRECYGAYAKAMVWQMPTTRVKMNLTGVKTVVDVAEAVKNAIEAEDEAAKVLVRDLLDGVFSEVDSESDAGLTVKSLEGVDFSGDGVFEPNPVYISLVRNTGKKQMRHMPSFNL